MSNYIRAKITTSMMHKESIVSAASFKLFCANCLDKSRPLIVQNLNVKTVVRSFWLRFLVRCDWAARQVGQRGSHHWIGLRLWLTAVLIFDGGSSETGR